MVKVKRILCPVDFSRHSHAALEQAEELASVFGAELLLVHVVEPVVYPVAYGVPASGVPGNLEDQAREGAESTLGELADKVRQRGLTVRSLVETGLASERLCALVDEHEADMVVMATHGLTGFQHMLLGSTAERMVRRCPVPVLTVKAGPGADEGRAR